MSIVLKSILVLAVAVSLAGCTKDITNSESTVSGRQTSDSGTTQATTDGTSVAPDQAVAATVSMTEFAYSPNQITLSAGTPSVIKVNNDGKMLHTFTIPDLGIDESLSPGESQLITVEAPEVGEYQLLCTISNHAALGMVGTVIVE